MSDSDALLIKAERFIRSARLLADDGDFDSAAASGLSDVDIESLTDEAVSFLAAARNWLHNRSNLDPQQP